MVYFINYTYQSPKYRILIYLKNSLKGGVIMAFKVPNGINKVPFSIRVDEDDFEIISKLSKKNKKSYNYIVNSMIKFAIKNMDIKDLKAVKDIDVEIK